MNIKKTIILGIIFSAQITFAHSVFVEELKKKCAHSLENLNSDADAQFAQKLLITKPKELKPMRMRHQVDSMLKAQSVEAKVYETDDFFKLESGKIVRRSVKSGKSELKPLSLLQLTKIISRRYPQASRIEVALEVETGNIYSLEVYGRHEFILRNLTTNRNFSFNSAELANPVNVFFTKNLNQSFLNIYYADSWNIAVTGMAQPLFNIDLSLVQ